MAVVGDDVALLPSLELNDAAYVPARPPFKRMPGHRYNCKAARDQPCKVTARDGCVAGITGGLFAAIASQPPDTIKTRLQVLGPPTAGGFLQRITHQIKRRCEQRSCHGLELAVPG